MDTQSYVSAPLVDMGQRSPAYKGVLTLATDLHAVPVGLTEQFTTNAAHYARSYASSDYFGGLIRRGFGLYSAGSPKSILDIGCGAGDNSTFPCLDMFPEAVVVATDLSPDLLSILLEKARRDGVSDRLSPICIDAMKGVFHEGRFEFVIGSAILHHLIEPQYAIRSAYEALSPGGVAMFFEPFELGHAILCSLYDRILTESHLRPDPIDPLIYHYFSTASDTIRKAIGRDKSADYFRTIDDKWLFGSSFIREIAFDAGFSDVKIESIHDSKGQMEQRINLLLALGAGRSFAALPDWAKHHVRTMDMLLTESGADVITEGIIALRK